MVVTYKLLGIAVPRLHPGSTLILAHADEGLFGQDFGHFLEPWTIPVLTDLFFLLYASFFVYYQFPLIIGNMGQAVAFAWEWSQ